MSVVPACCFWSNSESRYLSQGEPLNIKHESKRMLVS